MAWTPPIPANIRSFRLTDQPACAQLYREGLIGGTIAENDTAFDIDDIDAVYMRNAGNHFWVATNDAGQVVGMIGVQHHEEDVGEIRRLRVHRDFRRRGIGTALVETAVRFCRERNYLKVTLDTFMEREPALLLFEKFHFRHYRTRIVGGRELIYFYLDLYQTDREPRTR